MVSKVSTDHQGPLPGNGPWIRVDGVWYTKDATGEIVPMKTKAAKTRNRPNKQVEVKSQDNPSV